MWTLLVRILLILSGALLLLRLLKGRRSMQNRPPGSAPAARMVKDPVCGMYMDPRLAFRWDHEKEAYYFCSEECRKKFRADNG